MNLLRYSCFFFVFLLKVQLAEAKIMHVINLKHTLELVAPLKVCNLFQSGLSPESLPD